MKRKDTKRSPFRFFIGVLAGMLLYLAHHQLKAQDHNSLLWKVSGPGITEASYLFGTYHLIGANTLPENGKVLRAFQNAAGVAVEAELDSTEMMQAMIHTVMPDNAISKLLNEEDFALVDTEIQALIGQPLSALDQLKPMSIMLYMTIAYVNQIAPELAANSSDPLDKFFLESGRQQGKSIHTFETVMQQMELLYNSTSVEEQAEGLVDFVEEKELAIRLSKDLLDMYQNEKLFAMSELAASWEDKFGGMEALLDTRNQNWMQQLPQLLTKGNQFIAVGALHLPGEMGLINLLQQAGYTVTPVH